MGMRFRMSVGLLLFAFGGMLYAADAAEKQVDPDAAIANPKLRRAMQVERASISRKLKGGKDEFFLIVLTDTTWKKREPGIADAAQGVAFLVDVLALPVTAISGNAFAVSQQLPPAPPGTVREDAVTMVVVQGRDAAIQKVHDFTTALAFLPQETPRYRGWTLLAKNKEPEKVVAARDAFLRKLQTIQKGMEINQEITVNEDAQAAFAAPANPVVENPRDLLKPGDGFDERRKRLEDLRNGLRNNRVIEAKELDELRRIFRGELGVE